MRRETGTITTQLSFMPDVEVTCPTCKGARYGQETLEVLYRDKSIADVLEMSIEDGVDFFADQPTIARKIGVLDELGLGYLKLGHPSTILSGGEAQRVKLSKELARRATGRTVYILDEPTTGLHFEDVRKLLDVLKALVEQGNTVIVIEHNLEVVKTADWVIDLGPEGGDKGGQIVASGTPEEIAGTPGELHGPIPPDSSRPVGVGPAAKGAQAGLRDSTRAGHSGILRLREDPRALDNAAR